MPERPKQSAWYVRAHEPNGVEWSGPYLIPESAQREVERCAARGVKAEILETSEKVRRLVDAWTAKIKRELEANFERRRKESDGEQH
jgi:phosphatidylserine/phosphatidylglycerophosphate/cardiolipin synthase-like enzyme